MSTILTDARLHAGLGSGFVRDGTKQVITGSIEPERDGGSAGVRLHRVTGDQVWAVDGEALLAEVPVLLAAVRAITLNDAQAEDIVSASIEIALRHYGELRDPAAIRPWLLRIGTREAFRLRRRLARLVPLGREADTIAIAAESIAESLSVRSALRTLPPRMRAAVVLHHLVGLPVGEVASALGTSPNTVKTQLRVGLARLREELGDD